MGCARLPACVLAFFSVQLWLDFGLHPEHGYHWQFLSYPPHAAYELHSDCGADATRSQLNLTSPHARLATVIM